MSTKKSIASGPEDLTLISAMKLWATEEDARAWLESVRWPDGPFCPHCGNADASRICRIAANPAKKIRAGLHECLESTCGKQFTVTVGTVMEDSHVPLHKWLIAFYRMSASKTQVSAAQLQRELELGSYRTAWFMCHRIRFALTDPNPPDKLDGVVEVDETWVGGLAKNAHGDKVPPKTAVVSMIERGGRVRSKIVPAVNKDTLGVLLKENVDHHAVLNTDENKAYIESGTYYAAHDTVNHKAGEYVRRDKETRRVATINSAESYFGNTKRSIDGTHHSVSPQHLDLYLAETDFKFNERKVTDGTRTHKAVQKIEGKRLTLRPTKQKTSDGRSRTALVASEDRPDSKRSA